MKVAEATLTKISRDDQKVWYESFYFPHMVQQDFLGQLDLGLVEYLSDLDNFHTKYLAERQAWLKEHKIRHRQYHIALPGVESHDGSFFRLTLFFADLTDAMAYTHAWGKSS